MRFPGSGAIENGPAAGRHLSSPADDSELKSGVATHVRGIRAATVELVVASAEGAHGRAASGVRCWLCASPGDTGMRSPDADRGSTR